MDSSSYNAKVLCNFCLSCNYFSRWWPWRRGWCLQTTQSHWEVILFANQTIPLGGDNVCKPNNPTGRWWCLQTKQDWRWNADKPSAALDPYIRIWLTTSPANQRPANFLKSFFFQALKGNCEKCCIFRLNRWGPTSNLKLPFLDSSHTNNHLYIYQSIMEMLTYFHRMSLNKNCGCMIFSVAYRYRKSMSIIERVIYIYMYVYIYIYLKFLASYIRDPSRVYRNLPGGRK